MEKRIAQIISVLFHPLLIPFYGLLLLFSINSYFTMQIVWKARIALTIMMFSSTVIIPFILMVIYKRKGLITDFYMMNREERLYPYLTVVIIYFLLYYLFSSTALPAVFSFFMLTITIISLAVLFINLRWKISAHTSAIGGLTSMMIGLSYKFEADMFLTIILLILCSGIVGYSRLQAEAHKPAEVYTGYLLGGAIFAAMFWLF